MNEQIGIIIPVYNTEKYISACMESVLNQRLETFEVIMVNDGSNDHSGIICDQYALSDLRVRVLHQKNSDVSAARSAAIKIAKGESYIFQNLFVIQNLSTLYILL